MTRISGDSNTARAAQQASTSGTPHQAESSQAAAHDTASSNTGVHPVPLHRPGSGSSNLPPRKRASPGAPATQSPAHNDDIEAAAAQVVEPSAGELALAHYRATHRPSPDVAQGQLSELNAQLQVLAQLKQLPDGIRARAQFLQKNLGMVISAITTEVGGLALIAACVFGLTRTGGQTLGADKVKQLLDSSARTKDWSDPQKAALESFAGIVLGGAFAGVGVLSAQAGVVPVFKGVFRAVTAPLIGAYVLERSDAKAIYNAPHPFGTDGAPKLTSLRDEQLAQINENRGGLKARQKEQSSIASWFASNSILGAFFLSHGLRILLLGTHHTPGQEVALTAAASMIGGAGGQALITARKMLSRAEVITDDGVVSKRPLWHFANAVPDGASLTRAEHFAKEMKDGWQSFARGRSPDKLPMYILSQWAKHTGSVVKATVAVIPLAAAAARVREQQQLDKWSDAILTSLVTFGVFYAAMQVLVKEFPQHSDERDEVPPASPITSRSPAPTALPAPNET